MPKSEFLDACNITLVSFQLPVCVDKEFFTSIKQADSIIVVGDEWTCLQIGSFIVSVREKWTLRDAVKYVVGVTKLSVNLVDDKILEQYTEVLKQSGFEFISCRSTYD